MTERLEVSQKADLRTFASRPYLVGYLQLIGLVASYENQDPFNNYHCPHGALKGISLFEALRKKKKMKCPRNQWRPGLTPEMLVDSLDMAIQFSGLTNAWTMPIKTRIDMLATGIKTPVGIKVMGPDLDSLNAIAQR